MAALSCPAAGSWQARLPARSAILCTMLLAATLLPCTCLAAVQLAVDDGQAAQQSAAGAVGTEPTGPLWQHYEAMFPTARLLPVVTQMHDHEVLYQIPENPRATLFIAPGCSHAAHDWWPPSAACPDCLGLPEEMAHTQQALARSYAVISMSSKNAHGDMCMDWSSNHRDAIHILGEFREQQGLEQLPLYGLGVSVGGGFVLKLAAYVKMDGVVSEVLGPEPAVWEVDKYQQTGAGFPPVVFISMDQDPAMAARISGDSAMLRERGAMTETVCVAPRVVYPTFFSDRSSRISPETSAKVVAALHQIDMLDEQGMVTVDPRHSRRPWVRQLVELVEELDGGMTEDHSQVWEEMNLAWSCHEIISDFATAAFLWFESGAKTNFTQLVDQYGAPGHTGLVGDAAGAIHATSAAASSAPAEPAVQQVYEKHEAAELAAAEADAAPMASVGKPQPEQSSGDTAAVIEPGSGRQPEHASVVRELGSSVSEAVSQQQDMVNKEEQEEGEEEEEQEQRKPQDAAGASVLLPDEGAKQQPNKPASVVAAASMTVEKEEAASGTGSADSTDEGTGAALGSSPASASQGSGPRPAAILAGIGGAALGTALLLSVFRLVRPPKGFHSLPVADPHGCLSAKGQIHELPVSTRLTPTPELPESSCATTSMA